MLAVVFKSIIFTIFEILIAFYSHLPTIKDQIYDGRGQSEKLRMVSTLMQYTELQKSF